MTDKSEIANLLKRKQEIDEDSLTRSGSFTANQRWLTEAVKTLLKNELEKK